LIVLAGRRLVLRLVLSAFEFLLVVALAIFKDKGRAQSAALCAER